MKSNALTAPEKWILGGIPVLFITGALLHFAYDFFGQCPFIGAFAPVNESVWEHCKLVVLPIILWWGLYYLLRGEQNCIDKDKWFAGALAALLTALALIPLLFYFYTQAFGVELLWVDILLLLVADLLGQLVGLHVYRYADGISSDITLFILAAILIVFAVFTFYPPQIPLFQDSIAGQYGI